MPIDSCRELNTTHRATMSVKDPERKRAAGVSRTLKTTNLYGLRIHSTVCNGNEGIWDNDLQDHADVITNYFARMHAIDDSLKKIFGNVRLAVYQGLPTWSSSTKIESMKKNISVNQLSSPTRNILGYLKKSSHYDKRH